MAIKKQVYKSHLKLYSISRVMRKILILLGVIALLLVIVSIYGKRILGFRNKEYFTDGESSGELLIVKANWCGHCKAAMPDFERLVEASPVKLSDGSEITIRMLDEAENKADVTALNVRGFPTLLFKPDAMATHTEYSGPRTFDGVMSFLQNQ